MGFLDDIIAQQSGGGMLGGLPATWQYTNPESLSPVEKQMMGLVGTQNPDQAGFNPLPVQNGAFPTGGAAPIVGASPDGAPSAVTNPMAAPSASTAPMATTALDPNAAAPRAVYPAVISPENAQPPIFAPRAQSPAVAANEGDTPVANPAASASPIAIGGYRMPRIGPAAAFTPDPAALPTNSQPAQGQGLPAPAAAAPNVGDNLMAGYQNLRHGGGIIGSIVAAVTGKRNDASGVALQQQAQVANQTARALVGKGVDPSVALAAVQPGNGEMLKTLLTQTFGPQTVQALGEGYIVDKNGKISRAYEPEGKFQHVTVKNPDGSESLMSYDPSTGKYTGSPAPASLRSAVDPGLTGTERMVALTQADPNYARKIQAMVNGDIPMPTSGQAARSPQAARMIEDVLAVDGSTSASDFATRAATRKDYASGVASRVTKSLNTTIEHAARLDAAIDKLNNHTYFPGVTNWVHDKVQGNISPEYQKAKSDFESAKEAFIKELDFTLSGGHSSVSGSAELRDKINRADSPEALHAAIQTDLHLLSARLDSHTTGFNQGTRSQRDGQDFLYPKNRAVFNRLMGTRDTSTGGEVPGVDNTPATAAPAAEATATTAPAIPTLRVGESTTINGVSIKKVGN